MRLTVVGCGDAFGSGGRAQTCFWLGCGDMEVALDFGASSPVALKQRGLSVADLDLVVVSHLHGDHFGGLPFLLLECRYVLDRRRPLTIVGPPGLRGRLDILCEAMFPGAFAGERSFALTVVDLPCGEPFRHGGVEILTAQVVHPSGAPSTAIRLGHGGRVLAFSGDTSWTDALLPVAADADLFLYDCYQPDGEAVFHGDLATLRANRNRLGARRIMLTHMSEAMLARTAEALAEGFLVAHDGLVLDI